VIFSIAQRRGICHAADSIRAGDIFGSDVQDAVIAGIVDLNIILVRTYDLGEGKAEGLS
jgi:hypothetical protein